MDLRDDTWHYIVVTCDKSNAAGFIMYVDGVASGAAADPTGVGDITSAVSLDIGRYNGGGEYWEGDMADIQIYEDTVLSPAEILDNYERGKPTNKTNLKLWWAMLEGSGDAISDSSGEGNTGTNNGAGWVNTIGRFLITVDDVIEATFITEPTPPSILDNANQWAMMQNNVLPYANSISISVNGTEAVRFAPSSMIIGTTLPNELNPGTNDGVITWGANPASIGAVLGSMISSGQPGIGVTDDTATSDILPVAGGTDWDRVPAVSGALLANPMRPTVTAVSDNTTLSEYQVWIWFGIIFVVFITVLVGANVHGHHLITGVAASAAIVLMVVWTVFPLLSLLVIVLAIWGGMVSERSPSL